MFIYYVFCLLASFAISIFYVINYKKTYNIFISLIQILVPIVLIANFCIGISTDLEEALVLDALVCLFMIYYFPLLLCGILELLNYHLKKWQLLILFFVQTVIYACIARSDVSKLFFTTASLVRSENIALLSKIYTPYYVLLNAYIFAFVILIIISLLLLKKMNKMYYSLNIAMMFVYFFIVSISYFIINLNYEHTHIEIFIEVILQGVSAYIASTFAYYNIDTYLLNNNENIIDSGIVIFNSNKQLVAYNKKVLEWFPEFKNLIIGKKITSVTGVDIHFVHWLDLLENEEERTDGIIKSGDNSIRTVGTIKEFNKKDFYYFALSNYTAEEHLLKIIESDSNKINETFKQYLDPKLYNSIINDSKVTSSGKEMTVAVMFADIRNFTSITENIDSNIIIKILNTYLSLAENIIHKNGGILDKYIGDAVMAFWVDTGNGDAAYLAAKSALEIKEAVIKLEDKTYNEIFREIFFGIGLNYGKAILGDVGSNNLKNYTIIGDTVNTASRLENITPKNCIYVTEPFANVISKSMNIKKIDDYLRVKGKAEALTIYEIVGIKNKKFVQNPIVNIEQNIIKPVLYICGVRGSYAVSGERFSKYGGDTTCFVIKQKKHAIVIDCGSGLSNAKPILKDCTKIDVLLTHMHYDHCIGLLNWNTFPQGIKPTFYGNFNSWNKEKSISELFRAPFWPVNLFDGKIVSITDKPVKIGAFEVTFMDANHPNEAKVIYLSNKKKNILIMADAENCNEVDEKYLKDLDYLIYDGMYDDSEYKDHIGWGHSTWQEGVRIAQKYNVGQLIITHHNVESTDNILTQREEKAKTMYPKTMFAKIDERIVI